MDQIRVWLAKQLSPDMYACAVRESRTALKLYVVESTLDSVVESLMQELYDIGVSEARIHEVVERGGHEAVMKHDLFQFAAAEAAGVEISDDMIAGHSTYTLEK